MNYYVYESTPDFLCGHMEKYGSFNMLCHHYHETYEILIMLDGIRYAFVGDGIHRMEKGDIMVIKPYTLHLTENRESGYFKRYLLNFSDKVLKSVLTEDECASLLSDVHTGLVHADSDNMRVILRLTENMSGENKAAGLPRKKTAANILVLLDLLNKLPPKYAGIADREIICSDHFAAALNYINRHFSEDLTLDFIVDYAHMSKANFCRVFKKETGDTFLHYVNNLRLAYAHNLLAQTDMRIQQISEKAGFSSLLHFERVFKKANGIPPSSARKKQEY